MIVCDLKNPDINKSIILNKLLFSGKLFIPKEKVIFPYYAKSQFVFWLTITLIIVYKQYNDSWGGGRSTHSP